MKILKRVSSLVEFETRLLFFGYGFDWWNMVSNVIVGIGIGIGIV
jgi:hypothetical protein